MKWIAVICLAMVLSGCFTAKWDETELRVEALGVNKELEGLRITQNTDGSFTIEIDKSNVQGQESMMAIMKAIYEAGQTAGAAGIIP